LGELEIAIDAASVVKVRATRAVKVIAASAVKVLAASVVKVLDAVGTVVMFDRRLISIGKDYLVFQEINLFCKGQRLGS